MDNNEPFVFSLNSAERNSVFDIFQNHIGENIPIDNGNGCEIFSKFKYGTFVFWNGDPYFVMACKIKSDVLVTVDLFADLINFAGKGYKNIPFSEIQTTKIFMLKSENIPVQ
jgi:hypothetical protein